jgi:hypothetical protein
MGKNSGSVTGMNNPDHISQSLETNFWVKILKFSDPDPGWKKFGSGIRDKHPGSATLVVFDPRMILPMSALTALIFCSGTVFQILAIRTMALASMIPYPKECE